MFLELWKMLLEVINAHFDYSLQVYPKLYCFNLIVTILFLLSSKTYIAQMLLSMQTIK